MSVNLMASLGLDEVSGDPNKVPDNSYDCFVADVEYVTPANNNVGHVITYQIESGDHKGARISDWFTVGTDPVRDANGALVGYTPTMTDANKNWYKKAFIDLGMTPEQVGHVDPKSLIGTKVTVTVKTNAKDSRYQNVTQRVLRGAATGASAPANPEFTTQTISSADVGTIPAAPAQDIASQL